MKVYACIALSILLFSCTKKKPHEAETSSVDTVGGQLEFKMVNVDARKIGPAKSTEQIQLEEAVAKLDANANNPVVGYWVGMFGKNKINIAIAEVQNKKALGFTVCAGNYRPITGTAENIGDSIYTFDMNEPGTDKYDGHFQFKIETAQKKMTGSWSPFKKGIVPPKEFDLEKISYQYDPHAGTFPESSARLLEEQDVSNLTKEELEVMRNEIYARHGYSFKDIAMRRYFDTIQWYIPLGVDIREKLTDTEVRNIDLIYRYEDYYNEEYDSYGR